MIDEHHAAAERDHERLPVVVVLDEGPAEVVDICHGLGGLAGGDEVAGDRQAGLPELADVESSLRSGAPDWNACHISMAVPMYCSSTSTVSSS